MGPAGGRCRRGVPQAPVGTSRAPTAASTSEDFLGAFDFHDLRDGAAFTVGPFTVTPTRVQHPVESYGFRVEANGRVLAYTGDTDACDALGPLMAGADLVLADSAFVDGRDTVTGIHLSGSRAAEAAVRAGGVGRLMLTHLPAVERPGGLSGAGSRGVAA